LSYKATFSPKEEYIFQKENSFHFQDGKLNGYIDNISFDDGLSLIKSDIKFSDNHDIKLENDAKSVVVTFLLEGSSKYDSSYTSSILAKKDHTTIVMNSHANGVKKYKKNTHLKSIQLVLNEEYFKSFLEEKLFESDLLKRFNKPTDFLECIKQNKTNVQTKIKLYEIFNIPLEDKFSKILVQSKALDILHLQLKELFLPMQNKTNDLRFSEYDKQAILLAKDILIENMQNPPSLTELSKMTKINVFKLKMGFKIFFNNTPYGILLEYKLQKAKQLLLKSEYDANEIANMVGYKHPCNFTTAFIKRFGVRPKDIMKTRNYYY